MAVSVTNSLLLLPDGRLLNHNISFNTKNLFAFVDFLGNIQGKGLQKLRLSRK